MKTSVHKPSFDFIKTNIFNFSVFKIYLGMSGRRAGRVREHVGNVEDVGHVISPDLKHILL